MLGGLKLSLLWTLFIVTVCLLNVLIVWIKNKLYISKELKKSELSLKIVEISNRYEKINTQNGFECLPVLKKYMKQCDYIKSSYLFKLEELEFSVESPNYNSDKDYSESIKIAKELNGATKEIKIMISDLNEVLEQIYCIKHPVKYSIEKIKKNIIVHILKLLVKICEILTKKRIDESTISDMYSQESSCNLKVAKV